MSRSTVLPVILSLLLSLSACAARQAPSGSRSFGETEITTWQDGKTGAVSLTYDDGIRTQFTRALPTMNRLGLPGTFYIVTGEVAGSRNPAKFVGRSIDEIVEESKTVPTNAANFFERAGALEYAGYEGAYELHRDAYNAFSPNRPDAAYRVVDAAYARIRAGELPRGRNTTAEAAQSGENSWDEIRRFAAQGHEFGSHTVTHAALAVLDEPNMLYELEKSREDILRELGEAHTFSVEGPFGVSDPRVMEYLLRLYPAPRNVMRDPYLEILLRGSRKAPGSSEREYVQWQKGPDGTTNDENATDTPLDEMKAWVDTTLAHQNIWLTLVFHGVDGKGWSAMPGERVDGFLEYVKAHEDRLWVATFGDATRYMRERKSGRVEAAESGGRLTVNVTHPLERRWYSLPLTLKTAVIGDRRTVRVRQGEREQQVPVREDGGRRYVLYRVAPNEGPVTLSAR
jgi:peptidoglycan/xylan/chitin deacetylase (PgdA/CDA1 family)